MKKWVFLGMGLFCTSCVAAVGPHGTTVTVAPPLPVVVELYEPYYVYKNYHYYYKGERWYYSSSKAGPWTELPRDRYPREIRHKGPVYDRDREDRQGKGDDRRWKDDQRGGKDPGWRNDQGKGKDPDWKGDRGRDNDPGRGEGRGQRDDKKGKEDRGRGTKDRGDRD